MFNLHTPKKLIITGALSLLLMPLLAVCGLARAQGYLAAHKDVIVPLSVIVIILIVFVYFILKREQKERVLAIRDREKELMLDNLIKNIPGGVAVYRIGKTNEIRYVSEGAAQLVGRTVAQFKQWSAGDTIGNTTYEDDVARVRIVISEAVADGKPIETNFRMKHKSGRLVWVQLSSVKIREEDGDSIYYAIFTKMPEESVLYKHITDDAATGVYVCDAETLDMIYANDVLQKLICDSDYKGKKCYEYTSALSSPCERCLRKEMTEKRYCTREAYAAQTGRYIALEGHLGNYDGRSVIICYTIDITDIHSQLVEKEDQLRDALEQARSANDAKTDFLSQMSHDIRTPMNAIIGLAALAKADVRDAALVNDYLDKINGSASFLLGLVNDCLDMEKIAQGKLTLNPAPYSYRDFTSRLVTMMEPLCREKNIAFSIEPRQHHNSIVVDKLRFEQIFFNLLSNAVKFTPKGGKIELLYRNEVYENGNIELDYVVKDSGCGMSEQFQQRMFTPFEQDEAQANRPHGTGLGLSIVKSIVDIMGGTISVNSSPGNGTEMIVRLKTPLLPGEEETQECLDAAEYDRVLKGRSVLLAEDDIVNMEVARRLLESKSMVVTVAENGEAAVQAFEGSKLSGFDVVVMDIRMPVMDGLAATRAIRALPRPDAKTVPIIAMTANAFAQDCRLSLEAGMNAHLSKPIEPELMFETLARYISPKEKHPEEL